MWYRGSHCPPSGKMHTFLRGEGKGLVILCSCFQIERLILECVYVKYLRSLSSHVYRFISKITKANHII